MKTSKNAIVGERDKGGEDVTLSDKAEVAPACARPIELPAIGRLNEDLADAILRKVGGVDALAEHLRQIIENASTSTRKDGVEYITVDHKTRLAALQLALHYLVGKPIERQQIVTANVNAGSEDELIKRLAASPAMRNALKEIVDAAEKPLVEQ